MESKRKVPTKISKRKTIVRNCDDCTISRIVGSSDGVVIPARAFPATAKKVFTDVRENVNTLQITVTPSCPGCPCKWRSLKVGYIRVHTGHTTLKRKNLVMSWQLIEQDTLPATNPYFTIANCVATISIRQLNSDMRNGIGPFTKAIPIAIGGVVRCNGKEKEIHINIID
ncbi:hypothetical protein [Candidatus Nitrosarchaeum limnium]|jgi:hypothetical protein|uniref:Uncharacterized protein n=1 Tax=Candidatus Nitrosarchaeum limnium BG20 TaxID=859192 RepID=S2E427_9ARCH|nr:hypothetical protein [Candidatus Nitrosarchaeum limnium]EPA05980.1 hypothetical protein BG20_I1479 [Candidatus Nitrosarchaeum limnium BG20]